MKNEEDSFQILIIVLLVKSLQDWILTIYIIIKKYHEKYFR